MQLQIFDVWYQSIKYVFPSWQLVSYENLETSMSDKYKFVVFSLYAQIALLDTLDPFSYPEWKTGNEKAVISKHGIAIATAGDSNIEIIIKDCEDVSDENLYPCISSMITIGENGLLVGNIPSGNVNKVSWEAGDIFVKVYTNHIVPSNVTKVVFALG
jgi:hypothetical protein